MSYGQEEKEEDSVTAGGYKQGQTDRSSEGKIKGVWRRNKDHKKDAALGTRTVLCRKTTDRKLSHTLDQKTILVGKKIKSLWDEVK